jgi:AcrR family transcriptional regulator
MAVTLTTTLYIRREIRQIDGKLRWLTSKRKPDAAERRRLLCDSAITLLAEHGAKGLSHLKIDRHTGVPDGTTSFYFRTRSSLLLGIGERVSELDWHNLWSAGNAAAPLTQLATLIARTADEPHLSRTKARYELLLQATRDPLLFTAFQSDVARYDTLCRDVVSQLTPPGTDPAAPLITDLSFALSTFLNGAIFGLVYGARSVGTVAHTEALLRAVINGVLAAHTP